jgi:hypothetical protein
MMQEVGWREMRSDGGLVGRLGSGCGCGCRRKCGGGDGTMRKKERKKERKKVGSIFLLCCCFFVLFLRRKWQKGVEVTCVSLWGDA